MRVAFRVDASLDIGTGHVMRCLALADKLGRAGHRCIFYCRSVTPELTASIRAGGHQLELLAAPGSPQASTARSNQPAHAAWLLVSPEADAAELTKRLEVTERADWLVIDHYGIDLRWERLVRPFVGAILVIDDLADRRHECDVLLDQNYYRGAESRYAALVPASCHQLIGPGYVILRPEFERLKATRERDRTTVRRILVNFGGVDPDNITGLALEGLIALQSPTIAVDVVVGASNPNRERLADQLTVIPNSTLHIQTTKMADLIAEADIAMGACGTGAWERCYLGVPSLVVVLAENQRLAAADLHSDGIIESLGDAKYISGMGFATALRQFIDDPIKRARLARRSVEIMSISHGDVLNFMR